METPVLFLVFNRPDETRRVFEAIRAVRPRRLFVAADGPRDERPEDIPLCEAVRNVVEAVDWDSDIQYRFLDRNRGCRLAVSSAIDWFFEHCEEGVILEDDCVPNPDFFQFCTDILSLYRDESKVMQVSGSNYVAPYRPENGDHYFSRLNDIWGWATWRRAWRHFDLSMPGYAQYRKEGRIRDYMPDPGMARWLELYFDDAATGESTVWSSQWTYAMAREGGLTAVPAVNLVENIGIGGAGTHSTDSAWQVYASTGTHAIPRIAEPLPVRPDDEADRRRFEVVKATDPRARTGTQLRHRVGRQLKNILPLWAVDMLRKSRRLAARMRQNVAH